MLNFHKDLFLWVCEKGKINNPQNVGTNEVNYLHITIKMGETPTYPKHQNFATQNSLQESCTCTGVSVKIEGASRFE